MGRPRKFAAIPVTRHGQVGIVGGKLVCGTVFVWQDFRQDEQEQQDAKKDRQSRRHGLQFPPTLPAPESHPENLVHPVQDSPVQTVLGDADLQACLNELAEAHLGEIGRGYDLRRIVKNPLLRERIAAAIHESLAELQFHQCEACGNWLVIGPGFARETARHCNGTCRQREYMKRQRNGGQKAGGTS